VKGDVKRASSNLPECSHQYEPLFAESIALQMRDECLPQTHSMAMKDLESVHEELSTAAAQLASARLELTTALPALESTENKLRTAKSGLTLARSSLVDAIVEISYLKTSLEHMSHSCEQKKLEKEVAERRLITLLEAQLQCLKPSPVCSPTIPPFQQRSPNANPTYPSLDTIRPDQDERQSFEGPLLSITADGILLPIHYPHSISPFTPSHILYQYPGSHHSYLSTSFPPK